MKRSTLILTIVALAIGAQAAIVGVAVYAKSQNRSATASSAAASKTGFVKVGMPEGAVANEVLVVGPDCDRPEGLRTRALASSLAQLNIPHRRTDRISMNSESSEDIFENISKLDSLMQEDAPTVFINAKGKANPTIDEVVAEYRSAVPR